MSDIIFVTPTTEADISNEIPGTLLLVSILKEKGLNAEVYRFLEASQDKGFENFINESAENILRKSPKIVSFYCRCDYYLADIMIAKRIKELSPQTYTVFGGPQADTCAKDTVNEIPSVDFCCIGEGETTVYPLFSALLNGTDYTSVDGLTYRNAEGEVVQNKRPELIKDLDTLPYQDFSLMLPEALDKAVKENDYFAIDVGRGCPFNCAYCSTGLFWQRKFRLKSTERIIDEMEKINAEFGVTKFGFKHDLFTASKKRVMDFLSTYKEKGLDYEWYCSSRIDTLDEEMIEAIASCGLQFIYLGIETGSERMQKLIGKNLSVEDIESTVACLVKNGIDIIASFMYGFPEEQEEDIEQTLQLIYRLHRMGVRNFQYHLCTIMPGTRYYTDYFEQLTLSRLHSDMISDFGVEECEDFIREHIRVFPYFYEYVSELREKFGLLNTYANTCIYLYRFLCDLLPEKYESTKITELFFKLSSIYENKEKPKSKILMMKDFITENFQGEEREKLVEILRFYSYQYKALSTEGFTSDVQSFSVDISKVQKGKKLGDIPFADTLVYFNMVNDELKTTAVNMSVLK